MIMSSLKSQIQLLRKDLKNYDKKLPVMTLDDGSEIKVGPKDLLCALSSIGSNCEHRIVREIRGKQITGYTGNGNMPHLIKSIVDSMELNYGG